MRRAPFLCAALAGILGIAFVDRGSWVLLAVLGGILLVATGLVSRDRLSAFGGLRGVCGLSLLALALGAWRHHERLGHSEAFPLAVALAEGKPIRIEGEGWVADTVVPNGRSVSTSVHLTSLVIGGRSLPCDQRLPAWIQRQETLPYGTRATFSGRLVPLAGASVPGGFDAREFYFRQSGALARLEIADGDAFTILPGRSGYALVRHARDLRAKLEAILLEGLPPASEPYARLIAAMTLGAREHSPEELEEHFRNSGTLHLFAVSGMHVGVVAGLLLGATLLVGIPRTQAVWLVIPLLLFYSVLTGLSPSAVRAATMLAVFLAGYGLREKPRLVNSLGFAALLLLLVDSQQLFLPGFQLSFTVLFFIATLASPISRTLAGPFIADPFLPKSLVRPLRRNCDRVSRALAASLAISLASWLGSAGLLAWHFQSLSPVGVVANVFMVPFAGIVIGAAFATFIAQGIGMGWLALLVNQLNVVITTVLVAFAQFFASLPGAYLHTGRENAPDRGEATLRLDLMGSRGESATLLTIPSAPGAKPLLWMIDTGGARTYRGSILPLLRSRGIHRLDALVLTHGDVGHLGAAPEVIAQFRPSMLFESSVDNRSPFHPEIAAVAAQVGVRTIAMDRGHLLRLGGSTLATVLHPSSQSPGRLADDRALVLKLSYAGGTILFTSDSGFNTEKSLLESGADLRADLWIRGQHLETPGALPAFVDAVSPSAVVSTDADFPVGERIPESLRQILAERDIALFELTERGIVSVEIDEANILVTPFDRQEEALRIERRKF